MTKITAILCFVLTAFLCSRVNGQRFSMGFNSGIVFSQLDGDGFTGYDKLGVRLGIRSQAYLSPSLDFIVELNYEQKGSRFEAKDSENPGLKNQFVRLDYAEVPLLLRFYFKERRMLFGEAGLAVSYLVRNSFKDGNTGQTIMRYEDALPNFERSEFNAVLGGGIAISPRLGLILRTSIGLNRLYYNAEVVNQVAQLPPAQRHDSHVPLVLLRNYLVSAGVYFLL
ncbi:MAG: PorT family protein [Saprospiraceae bacterium]|nr:PorT family protein [Saprospiraceae bacterium]